MGRAHNCTKLGYQYILVRLSWCTWLYQVKQVSFTCWQGVQPIAGPSNQSLSLAPLDGTHQQFPIGTPMPAHTPVIPITFSEAPSHPHQFMGFTLGESNFSHREHNLFTATITTDETVHYFPPINMEDPTTRLPLTPVDESEEAFHTPATQARLLNVLDEISACLGCTNLPPVLQPTMCAKPWAPDTFNGSDPMKLETFILQFSLYIILHATDVPDEKAKVSFILSYLKGSLLDWFQTDLINGSVTWLQDTQLFLNKLQCLFSSWDPVADVTTAIENLWYQVLWKYLVTCIYEYVSLGHIFFIVLILPSSSCCYAYRLLPYVHVLCPVLFFSLFEYLSSSTLG